LHILTNAWQERIAIRTLKGRPISRGQAEGEALVTNQSISFLGSIDPDTGIVVEKGHELEGKDVTGKVLVFPSGKGSTVGSYVMYQLKKNGTAPAAVINRSAEPIVAVGAIISDIPMVDSTEPDAIDIIRTGDRVRVDGTRGAVDIL
jgi:phosphomecalonate degydratase small subunit